VKFEILTSLHPEVGPPKRWYPTTSLHDVLTQKTAT